MHTNDGGGPPPRFPSISLFLDCGPRPTSVLLVGCWLASLAVQFVRRFLQFFQLAHPAPTVSIGLLSHTILIRSHLYHVRWHDGTRPHAQEQIAYSKPPHKYTIRTSALRNNPTPNHISLKSRYAEYRDRALVTLNLFFA